jgi:hypothetical protein
MTTKCEELHENAFNAHPAGYSIIQLQEVNVELLKRYAGLQSWSNCENPSLLLLLGDNMEENDDNRGLLWLSPAAQQILQTFNDPTITAFYSPSPQQPGGYCSRKVPFEHMLSSVIHQLLNSSSIFFHEHYDHVYRQLKQEGDGSCVRREILLTLLRSFKKHQTVVMVLDRLDLIERDDFDSWEMIDELVEVIADPKIVCTIKLAVLGMQAGLIGIKRVDKVARKRNWAKMKGREVVVHGKLDWRQEALDDN